MAKTAFILGGTGQIGRAVALNLLAHGWQVRIAHRGGRPLAQEVRAAGAEEVWCDRQDSVSLQQALGDGADLVVDCIAYNADHARQLLEIDAAIGALAVVSSASVYCDEQGRTLDEARYNGFPEFAGPITEQQDTVAPGPQTYSTNKVALERLLLDETRVPVTILRPCAIYGPGSSHAREWWFVKRALDRRTRVPLAYAGKSHFHTTATVNIAEVCRRSAELGGTRIVNVGDPSPPSVSAIGHAIATALNHKWDLVPVAGAPTGHVGQTPWSVPRLFLLDTALCMTVAAVALTTYPEFIATTCNDMLEAISQRHWREAFAALEQYGHDLFDYAAEDSLLATVDEASV